MSKLTYNILTISWDATLAMDKPDFGDAQKRNIKYGQHVQNLYSITYSKKNLNLKNKQLSENVFVYPTNSKNQLSFVSDAYKIAKEIIKENKIDMVLTQDPFLTGWVGAKIKKKFNIKLLIHFHGDFFANKLWLRENWFNYFLLFIGKRIVRQANAIRVMSQGIKNKLIKFGLAEKIIKVIPTPVDLEKFSINKNKSDNNKKIILSVGRLVLAKDFPTLIKAIKIVADKRQDFILKIAGGGPEYNKLKKLTADLDYIDLVGFVDHDDLPTEFQNCDLFVLSSTNESFGKVLVEANACAKPIISTATTGAKEIIQDGYNGFLVPIKDYKTLADKILYFLDNPDKSHQIGLNGRKLIEERFANTTKKIINFWYEIINDH